jgi:hypothetical protein
MNTATPTREQDHCTAHSDYRADCNPCFDVWLTNAEVRTQHYESVCSDIDEVLLSLSPFAVAWASAPESRRRYSERDDAEYWWKQGRMSANSAAIEDLNTIESMMKARGLK